MEIDIREMGSEALKKEATLQGTGGAVSVDKAKLLDKYWKKKGNPANPSENSTASPGNDPEEPSPSIKKETAQSPSTIKDDDEDDDEDNAVALDVQKDEDFDTITFELSLFVRPPGVQRTYIHWVANLPNEEYGHSDVWEA